MKMHHNRVVTIGALFFWVSLSCSSGPTPKNIVMDFLEKDMANSDTAEILGKLDLESVVKERKEDFLAAGDSIRTQNYTADSLIRDLTLGGELNQRWLAHQIILSRVIEKGDSAEVEVSFIDATHDVQYYNRMGLRKADGAWKIYSFKTLK